MSYVDKKLGVFNFCDSKIIRLLAFCMQILFGRIILVSKKVEACMALENMIPISLQVLLIM